MNIIAIPMTLEQHPLEPFLPENAKVLFLGSFPPPKQRWCMDFYSSDAFLEIVETTDLRALLRRIPLCHAIATTGEKATGEVCRYFGLDKIPALGTVTELEPELSLYRLPSSSRAYPLAFDKKVEAYREMFKKCNFVFD